MYKLWSDPVSGAANGINSLAHSSTRWSSGAEPIAPPMTALKDKYWMTNTRLSSPFPQRAHTLSTGSDGNDTDSNSCGGSGADSLSPTMSPFGSPSKYSPLHWSLSRETFANTTVHSAPTLETISRSLFADNKDIIRIEFEANGKEVPIDVVSAGAAPPKHVIRYVSSAVNLVRSYEMFGKNGFTYAQLTAPVGQRLKETVAGDGNRSRNKRRIKTETHCKFCKNNNETPEMYNSHVCKDPNGVTVCPVLRNYDCPKCRSGGGDSAHTLRYCPLNKEGDKDYKPSVIKVLKNGRSADGKKRYV